MILDHKRVSAIEVSPEEDETIWKCNWSVTWGTSQMTPLSNSKYETLLANGITAHMSSYGKLTLNVNWIESCFFFPQNVETIRKKDGSDWNHEKSTEVLVLVLNYFGSTGYWYLITYPTKYLVLVLVLNIFLVLVLILNYFGCTCAHLWLWLVNTLVLACLIYFVKKISDS